ncbi:MAG: type I DNA topoisomerase, partial [Deltaproteobacteria bacterium]
MKAKTLIIVESPTKARTIREILGKDFAIEASLGHIKDLPEGELGVDIKGGFLPRYEIIKGKERVLERLKRLASSSSTVLLATDPDREGEAIAWHIAEEIGRGKELKRVLIHEITPQGIREAMAHPMDLRETLFRAQQARRILDRLVGYQISPLLWRKLKGGLSAGRVQSIALRLIWEREREIEEFRPQEYWTLSVLLEHPQRPPAFKAQLKSHRGSKLKIRTEKEAQEILMALQGEKFVVKAVKKKQKGRKPPPPFTTSTLQQEASKRLGFSVKETMAIAQRLYEGVDLGPLGKRGLITYMRTDSVRISPRAVEAARAFI